MLLDEKQLSDATAKDSGGHGGAPHPGGRRRPPLTVAELVRVLRLHVSTAECDVFAYPSLEGDVVVLVIAVTPAPTKLQVFKREAVVLRDMK